MDGEAEASVSFVYGRNENERKGKDVEGKEKEREGKGRERETKGNKLSDYSPFNDCQNSIINHN